MDKNPDITNFAVSLIIKAVVIAARFSGRVRKRSLKRLAAMEVDAKDKEILFLRDMVDQLKMHQSFKKGSRRNIRTLDTPFAKSFSSSDKWKHTRYQGVG